MDNNKAYVLLYERIDMKNPSKTEYFIEGIFRDKKDAEDYMHEEWGNTIAELDEDGVDVISTEKNNFYCVINVGSGCDTTCVSRWKITSHAIL